MIAPPSTPAVSGSNPTGIACHRIPRHSAGAGEAGRALYKLADKANALNVMENARGPAYAPGMYICTAMAWVGPVLKSTQGYVQPWLEDQSTFLNYLVSSAYWACAYCALPARSTWGNNT